MANGNRIQGDYGALEAIARVFDEHSQDTLHLMQQIRSHADGLQRGGWTGLGAQAFHKELQELVGPSLERLADALADGQETTLRICAVFRDAEEEACRCFEDGNGAVSGGSAGGSADVPAMPIGANVAPPAGPSSVIVSPLDYQDGVDGWQLIAGANKFAFHDLVSQTGETCALYAPINLLMMSGRKYTQGEADAIVFGMGEFLKWDSWNNPSEGDWESWNKDKWSDGDPGSFHRHFKAIFEAEGAWDKVDAGMFFGAGPGGSTVFDRGAAEKYLISSLQKGKPVLVSTGTKGIFTTDDGRHAYNIIGVKTDSAGRLTSVLASTNHDGSPFREIPAADFMSAWAEEHGLHFSMRR
jgi:WXG100 family type VII secretion target